MGDYYRSDCGVHYILNAAGADYTWQIDPEIFISKVVDGFAMTMRADICHGGSVTSAIWNGIEFINNIGVGQGCGANLYITTAPLTSYQTWAPTEPGTQDDNAPLFGTSNWQLLGKNAAGDGMLRRLQSGYWLRPSEILIAGNPAVNTREVTNVVQTTKTQIGAYGNDHIVTIFNDFEVPEDPIIQAGPQASFIPFYFYSPNISGAGFNKQTWVDFTTGATRAYSAGQTSTTEVVMCSLADDSRAAACVYGPGVLRPGDGGFYEAFKATSSIRMVFQRASIVFQRLGVLVRPPM